MLTSGILDADGYYRGPYEEGAVFMLLESTELRSQKDPTEIPLFTFVMNVLRLAGIC